MSVPVVATRRLLLSCLVAALFLVVPTASTAAPSRPAPVRDFVVTATIGGLYPGIRTTSEVRIWNPNGKPLTVTRITTRVFGFRRSCPAGNLVVGDFTGSVTVPALRTGVARVPVSMPPSAPDGCQGATFLLTFSGTGTLP